MELTAEQTIRRSLPFLVQTHPVDYDGYPFITLILHKYRHVITIVDNVDTNNVKAYVLDLCGPEGVNEEMVITVASEWYEDNRNRYPLSIEFSRQGLNDETCRIYKTYNNDSITRVVGPLYVYPMDEVIKVRRRKRREIPTAVEIREKLLSVRI
jgi:hypothetical protein